MDNAHDNERLDPQARSADCQDRREFLRLSVGAMAAIGSQAVLGSTKSVADDAATGRARPGTLPTIRIGSYNLTRLIVGSNPVEGYSHSTHNLDQHMREYFTTERTVEFISRCEQLGINTWQTGHGPSRKVIDALTTLRQRGSKIHWFCLAHGAPDQKLLKDILALKPIAVVHHGGETDALFHAGRREQVHDFVKKVHDAGVIAGVSSHNPANIAYIEDKGWENEFFMTCLYQVSRPEEEIRSKLGSGLVDEPYLKSDPDQMTQVIQQVKRPCLAFKILAAGRLCGSSKSVESAFQYTFSRIKKTDGVIVGMYPRFSDEIAMNIDLALRHGRPSGSP